ncbi:hypothetical protein GBA63_03635 [Rubrobacter tropicus]|uniref:Uncharacterized protein n=2 Tax=Rubrobacter tropicus TaxID=2653851 RepID=A0A6G8Q5U2_9ACTN|nr:hypothetical protein GBA63_03635 [Rubrobacter tropicus]
MRGPRASLKMTDLDRDGGRELILRNDGLYAVLSPRQGGRLIYLFTRGPRGGALVVGNPTDDWNFQEEINRYMDRPANHPGALADVGFEHDRYQTSLVDVDSHAFVEMTNVQAGSRMRGARKTVLLSPDGPALLVCYRLPEGFGAIETEACLSPDYYRLLRWGRSGLSATSGGERRQGARNGDVAVWLALAHDEDTRWGEPASPEVGHGLNVRARANSEHFHLLLGCGEIDDEGCRALLREGMDVLHEVGEEAEHTGARRGRAVSRPVGPVRPSRREPAAPGGGGER